jgi:hypothetical protein
MRHVSKTWLFLASACVSLTLFGSSALAEQKVGQVIALSGKATVSHGKSAKPETLAAHDPIYEKDVIQTEPAAKVKIGFDDGTQVTLAELSSLEIREFVVTPKPKTPNAFFVLAAGAFRAIVNNLSSRDAFKVQTPTAIAAVKGTDWMGEVKAGSTGVAVLQGKVGVSNVNPAIAGEVILTDLMGTDVAVDQPPTPPKEWGEKRRNALLKATDLP